MVHIIDAFSQSLEAVGSTKARISVIRYRPTRITTPSRATTRFILGDMEVTSFLYISVYLAVKTCFGS